MPSSSHTPVTAVRLLRALRERELSCVEAIESCLAAIEALDGRLHAWEEVGVDAALSRARELDRLPPAEVARLPLRGLPIGVKDVFDTADLPTRYGSPLYRHHRPGADAHSVALLRLAGAVIVGKTKTAEFACMHPADTGNPIDPRRTPGGSSSGSAAAVGAGMVPVATGTQTAGSIVRPASYCGVVGYKPTVGAISTAGVLPTSATLDTVGLLGASVDDVALVTEVLTTPLAGAPVLRSARPLDLRGARDELAGPPRLGFARAPWAELDPAARAAIEEALARIEGLGATIAEVDASSFELLARAQQVVQRRETAAALGADLISDPAGFSDELREYIEAAGAVTPEQHRAALLLADEWRVRWTGQLAGLDAVLAPSTLGVPPLGLGYTGDPLPSRPWTLLGFPSLALPLAWTPERLPIGLQLLGPIEGDAVLLRTGRWLLDRA